MYAKVTATLQVAISFLYFVQWKDESIYRMMLKIKDIKQNTFDTDELNVSFPKNMSCLSRIWMNLSMGATTWGLRGSVLGLLALMALPMAWSGMGGWHGMFSPGAGWHHFWYPMHWFGSRW